MVSFRIKQNTVVGKKKNAKTSNLKKTSMFFNVRFGFVLLVW